MLGRCLLVVIFVAAYVEWTSARAFDWVLGNGIRFFSCQEEIEESDRVLPADLFTFKAKFG